MNRVLAVVGAAFGFGGRTRSGRNVPRCAVFARIEEPLMPLERGRKYEDPLNSALRRAGLGRVAGGGSVQGLDGSIEWISLDLELFDLGLGLEFVRDQLRALGAPKGSVLKFKKGESIATVLIG